MGHPRGRLVVFGLGLLVAIHLQAAAPGECFGKLHPVSPEGFATFRIAAADVDGDGDTDVVAVGLPPDTLVWFENANGAGIFSLARPVTDRLSGASATITCDLDGDTDLDIVAIFENGLLAWFENVDGTGSFGPARPLADEVHGAVSPVAADLDLDGDPDLLVASVFTDRISWFENVDGAGSFGPIRVITTEASSPGSVFAGDLDGDRDLDVLSASTADGKIAWYENLGASSFGPQRIVDVATFPVTISAADLDGDGDNDVLTVASEAAWYENLDGRGEFGNRRIVDEQRVDAAIAADIDGDGRQDVVTVSWLAGRIAWFEQIARSDPFLAGRTVADLQYAATLAAEDMDGDGDRDVIAALAGGSDGDRIVWIENRNDGRGCDRDVICHCVPETHDRCLTLIIDENELRGHLDHGDASGACAP